MTLLPSLIVSIVIAAPPAAISRQHFERARHAFAQRDYKHALDDFTAAVETSAQELPDLWFDIAQCQRNLGRSRQAVLAFQRYLALKPDAADRGKVESMIVQLGGTPPEPPPAPEPQHEDPAPQEDAAPPVAVEPTPAPPPVVTSPPSVTVAPTPPALQLTAAPIEEPKPRHKSHWKAWTIVASTVAASALAVGLGVGLGLDTHAPTAMTPSNPMLGSAGTFDTRMRH